MSTPLTTPIQDLEEIFFHMKVSNSKSQTLTTPIQDLQEIFFHIKVSNSKSQTTPIQDSNHERKGPSERTCRGTRRRREEWQGRGDSTVTATGRDDACGAPRGGRSCKAGRAAGREEPCRVAATTDDGGCPLLREYDWRAIRSSHGKIHLFEIRKVIKKTKYHVKQSANVSNVVLVKSTIEVL